MVVPSVAEVWVDRHPHQPLVRVGILLVQSLAFDLGCTSLVLPCLQPMHHLAGSPSLGQPDSAAVMAAAMAAAVAAAAGTSLPTNNSNEAMAATAAVVAAAAANAADGRCAPTPIAQRHCGPYVIGHLPIWSS